MRSWGCCCQTHEIYISLMIKLFKYILSAQLMNSKSFESKRRQFQQLIRKKQMEDCMRDMREECLKAINLKDAIRQLEHFSPEFIAPQIQRLNQIISSLFAYVQSDEKDHLYELFDERCELKLIELAHWNNRKAYQSNPQLYIQIFLILCDYSQYNTRLPILFVENLQIIGREIIAFQNHYQNPQEILGFSPVQLKMIIEFYFASLANIGLENPEAIPYILDYQDCLLDLALRETEKLKSFFRYNTLENCEKEFNIFMNILYFFKEILTFNTKIESLQDRIYDLAVPIVENILEFLNIKQDQHLFIEKEILNTINSFLVLHLGKRPNILLVHNFEPFFLKYKFYFNEYYTLAEGMVEIEFPIEEKKVNPDNEKKLMQCLDIINVIFSVDISQNENKINFMRTIDQWLNYFIIPSFSKIFKLNDERNIKLIEKMFLTINNLCFEESHLQKVLQESSIINSIFFLIKSDNFTTLLRKRSLKCLANMIITSLDMKQSIKRQVSDLMNKNGAIEQLAEYIGTYAQSELNETLLDALEDWMESQVCEHPSQNNLWQQFCSFGGLKSLEKFLQSDNLQTETYQIASRILNKYDDN